MPLFKLSEKRLGLIKEKPFSLEKEIQDIVESNLQSLFGLQYVRNQFQVGNLRIDTLAYDRESKSFVIIEYKKDRNISVVDQGMSYLGLMLNNKAEFILEYNECCKASLKRDNVDWSQSKVIFISPSFTVFQLEAINFKDLPIELWEVRSFANGTVQFTLHKPTSSGATLKAVSKKSTDVAAISKEVKAYTEEQHLKIASQGIKELYSRIKELVLSISPEISVKPMKKYIAFRAKTNIADVQIQKKTLKIFINLKKGVLDDPKKIANDVSNVGHWGNGDYSIQISSDDSLEYIVSLIRQSFKINNG